MNVRLPILRTCSSPSRVVFVAGILACFYYLIFGFWGRGEGSLGRRAEGGARLRSEDESRRGRDAVGNSTLGFQKLFVINMPSRTDRRDATTLAFAISNISVEFVDGVKGDSIPEEAFPAGDREESLKLAKGIKGSWRGHMDVLQQIVYQGISTAIIFEDDVDWDIHLREQLKTFALASGLLSNPGFSNDLAIHDIQVTKNPETEESIHNASSLNPISANLHSFPLVSALSSLSPTPESGSPYGDPSHWDVLWLGHCGAGFPRPESTSLVPDIANIILTNPSDATVPSPKHLRAHPFGPLDALASSHAPHTRVYHRGSGGALCTVAYAVSQRGARRLLAEFGVKRWGRIWDVELGDWCASSFSSANGRGNNGNEKVCLTVQPPIFAHHHPPGGESNIVGLGGGYARGVETKYVRWSVRMNLDLLAGGGREGEIRDQWPDGDEEGEMVERGGVGVGEELEG